MGHSWLKGVGHLWLKWVGHLWLKWVVHLWLKWLGQFVIVFGEICSKTLVVRRVPFPVLTWRRVLGYQGSTLSGPRMTTGFGPFELLTGRLRLMMIFMLANLTQPSSCTDLFWYQANNFLMTEANTLPGQNVGIWQKVKLSVKDSLTVTYASMTVIMG